MADQSLLRPYPAFERHRRELAEAARRQRIRLAGGGMAVVVLALGAWMIHPMLAFMVSGIGAMVLFFASLSGGSTVSPDELLGIEGELRALKFLRQLGDDFALLNRVIISDATLPNGERELDFVVIGPNALFLVEVKNTAGLIHVQPDSATWPVARRGGCGSSPRWHSMSSPLFQVRAQADALNRLLLSHGLNVDIQPIICFARPGVALENVDSCPLPVLFPEQLRETIEAPAGQSNPNAASLRAATSLLANAGAARGTLETAGS